MLPVLTDRRRRQDTRDEIRDDVRRERQRQQAEIASLDQLRAELREISREKAEIEARVEAGELTGRALTNVRLRWEHLSLRIFHATSTYRNRLVDTAPDEVRDEYLAAIEQKRLCIARHQAAENRVPKLAGELVRETNRYDKIVERQSKPDAQRWPEHEHRQFQRRLAAMERELRAAEADLADAEQQLADALQEVADAKQRCIDA